MKMIEPGVFRISFEFKLPAWIWQSAYFARCRTLSQWFFFLGGNSISSASTFAKYADRYQQAMVSGSLAEIGSAAFWLRKRIADLDRDLEHVELTVNNLCGQENQTPGSITEAAALHRIARAGSSGLAVNDREKRLDWRITPAMAGLLETRDLAVVHPPRFGIGKPRVHLTAKGRGWVAANPEASIIRSIGDDLAA